MRARLPFDSPFALLRARSWQALAPLVKPRGFGLTLWLLCGVLSLTSAARAQGSGAPNSSANDPDRGVTSCEQIPRNTPKADADSPDKGSEHPDSADDKHCSPESGVGDAAPSATGQQDAPAQPEKAQAPAAPTSATESKAAKAPSVAPPQNDSVSDYGEQTLSLGDIARQTRKARLSKTQAVRENEEESNTAPGFQLFTLQYCMNPDQCSDASILIPENTEVLSRTNGQHIFKAVLNGGPVMLYLGPADVNAPYRSLTDADYLRMRNLANPFAASRDTANALSAEAMTIEGRPATLTRFRYEREQDTPWIGERTLIEMPDGQFMLVCTAPEQHFADAQALCKAVADSFRLP
jgi:hypothetical protein